MAKQPIKQKVATVTELPDFETATVDELPAFGEPLKKKDQPQLAKPTTTVSKSVSQPTKSLSALPLKNPNPPEELGYLEDIWNRLKGSSTKVLGAFASIPASANTYAMDIILAASGKDEQFNRLPAAAKKEVKNAIREINRKAPSGELAYQSKEASDYLNNAAKKIYERTIQDETSVSDEIYNLATNPTTEVGIKNDSYQQWFWSKSLVKLYWGDNATNWKNRLLMKVL